MPFTSLLKDTLTVKRLTATTGVKRTYQTPGAFAAMVQPLEAEQAQLRDLALGKSFKAFMDVDANILAGDLCTDQYTIEYRVQGVEKRRYGTKPHLEVILVLQEA